MDEPQRTIRICEQHGVPLYLLGCVLTADEDDAVTVVADAIGQRYDGPAAADLREGPDARRRLARHVYLEGSRLGGSSTPARPAAPGEAADRGSLPPAVLWLMRLSTQQRALIALCLFGGHTYREAAALMNIEADEAMTLLRDGCARALACRRTPVCGASTKPETPAARNVVRARPRRTNPPPFRRRTPGEAKAK
ncbi:MAG: hypothetical protein ACRDO7_18530 [Nocardioidaceae bacterium]